MHNFIYSLKIRSTPFALYRKHLRTAALALMVSVVSLQAIAGDGEYAAVESYVASAAASTGWSQAEVAAIIGQAQMQPRILEIMNKPAEKSMTWQEYRTRIVSADRIAAGRDFMIQYADPLARAEATYGVPKNVIAAILGIETRYGEKRGNYRVLDSLVTLSFGYPRRAAFFQKELTAFLKLARAGHVDPYTIKGSYAGAIGWPQFMPTSILALATDFDGDGKIDLYNSPVDAIGSVANYFSKNGWRQEGPVLTRLAGAAGSNLTMAPGDDAEFYHTDHNYKVIKRYNHSDMYAIAVFELSQALR